MPPPTRSLPFPEFVTLIAFMVSIVAMATDVMLPALGTIAGDLGVTNRNDVQLVVSMLFLGFAIGQFVVGPLSDRFGRRPAIFGGYVVFVAGCLLSIMSSNLTIMLFGRVLQGLGAATPRVVTLSLVRDCSEGRAMARIMSIVMSVFVLVPAIAPAVGQGIILVGHWRHTFVLLLVQAILAFAWFALRQPETLAPSDRRPLSPSSIATGVLTALSMRVVFGYILATGFIFGAFLGYLSSAQQVFQVAYRVGGLFPLYFAVAALAIGAATVLNSMLVMRLGMRRLTHGALVGMALVSAPFLWLVIATDGIPPFPLFMVWLLATFLCVGFLFGNLNALAMEPLGRMVGLGASVIGSAATFMSLPFGWFIGNRFDGGITALVAGFLVLGLAALAAVRWTEGLKPFTPPRGPAPGRR